MKTTGLFFLGLTLIASFAQAEYRVFVLKISDAPKDPKTPANFTLIESTLDPDQYRGYFPIAKGQTITYIDTWRCYGRTDHKDLCPNPRNPRQPASTTEGLDSSSNNPK